MFSGLRLNGLSHAVSLVLLVVGVWPTKPAYVAGSNGHTQQVFRAAVNEVALFLTVRDRDGYLLTDLKSEQFEVYDSGVRVPLSTFSNTPVPITAVVMADVSGSMVDFNRTRMALMRFVDTLLPGDRLQLGTFGDEVSLSWALTDDQSSLRRAIYEEFWPGGTSPLWRAIDASVSALHSEAGRKVIVVLTDGVDYAPGGTRGLPQLPGGFNGVRDRVRGLDGLMIYAVGFGDPKQGRRLRGDILSLVDLSGGGSIDVPPSADLGVALDQIGIELRQQYVLSFVPRQADGRQHSIQVKVDVPGAVVRSRRSYTAPAVNSPKVTRFVERVQ